MVKSRTGMKLFLLARIYVMCCTLVMLTATIIHNQDDGLKGIHLFFMPCQNWEIVEDPVWLSIKEQYKGVDFSILQSERARWLINHEPDLAAEFQYKAAHRANYHLPEYMLYEQYMLYQVYEEHQEREEYEEPGKHDDRAGNNIVRRALRRLPHAPDLSQNEIPVTSDLDVQISYTREYNVVEESVVEPGSWRDTTPTPPPRQVTLLPTRA